MILHIVGEVLIFILWSLCPRLVAHATKMSFITADVRGKNYNSYFLSAYEKAKIFTRTRKKDIC